MTSKQRGKFSGLLGGIVDSVQQDILDQQLTMGQIEMLPGSLQHLAHRVTMVVGHEKGPRAVVGSVQGKSQIDLGLSLGQPHDRPGYANG